jgi:hypothetical protein
MVRGGLPLSVLSLYKSLLRAAKGKEGFTEAIRAEFKKGSRRKKKSNSTKIWEKSRGGIHQICLQFFYDSSSIFLGLFPTRISQLFHAKS